MLPQMPRNEFNASISPKVSDTNFPLQSLFSWMALSTKSEVRSEKSEERFQSLFSWMALSTKSEVRSEKSEERFQSLFSKFQSWQRVSILVFMDGPLQLGTEAQEQPILRRFNPCFHGWPSSTDNGSQAQRGIFVSILVFMDGPLQHTLDSQITIELFRFNPCFHGWPSSTGNDIYTDVEEFWFQSLFSWMALFNLFIQIQSFHLTEFQSLFSWMALFNELSGDL